MFSFPLTKFHGTKIQYFTVYFAECLLLAPYYNMYICLFPYIVNNSDALQSLPTINYSSSDVPIQKIIELFIDDQAFPLSRGRMVWLIPIPILPPPVVSTTGDTQED
jgi:hypothetical protein